MEVIGEVPSGTILVDQTGAIVSNVVVKDRVLLAEEGLVAVVLTVDKKSGNLLTSPDIISRGFIYMREQEDMMNGLRTEVCRAVQQRYKRIDIDRFKAELKDHITHYLFEQTGRSPIVIPVLNIVGGKNENKAPRAKQTNLQNHRKHQRKLPPSSKRASRPCANVSSTKTPCRLSASGIDTSCIFAIIYICPEKRRTERNRRDIISRRTSWSAWRPKAYWRDFTGYTGPD